MYLKYYFKYMYFKILPITAQTRTEPRPQISLTRIEKLVKLGCGVLVIRERIQTNKQTDIQTR